MIALVFVACMKLAPEACEEHSMTFLEEGGAFGCMVRAQRELALWGEAHPDHTVTSWKCQVGRSGEDI